MKVLFFSVLICFTSIDSRCQQPGDNALPWSPPPVQYDTAPQFPGGPDGLKRYFAKNTRYPEYERSKRISGNVYVKFTVFEDGSIGNVELINGVPGGKNLAKEAVRLIENMPAWKPAVLKGKPVEAETRLNVPFRLRY